MRRSGLRAGFVLVMAIAGGRLAAQSAVFSLPPGRFAVGFRSVDLYDYTRTYRSGVSATGEAETRERARPVQTSIWYPAAGSPKDPMRFGDYFELMAHRDGPPTPASQEFAAKFLDAWRKEFASAAAFDSLLASPVGAVRDAAAAAGRFPVVVYNAGGGLPSWDNAVLFEYLASHGYVVIASPSTWNWELMRPVGPDIESAEAAARDIEFHIGYARSLPFVDSSRLAVMGYSWGGLAGPMVAARNSAVLAVVNLDGSVKYFPKVFAKAVHHDAADLRAAFFQLSQNWERTLLEATVRGQPIDSADLHRFNSSFEFYDQIRYADAYRAKMLKFHHGNFASYSTILDNDRRPGEPTGAEDQEGYTVLGRYVLAFLDAYVMGDSTARSWLQRSPADNGVPDGIIQVEATMASPLPAPTIEGLAQYGRRHGFDRLRAVVDSGHRADSTYILPERAATQWARLLDEAGMKRQALDLRRWAARLHPASLGVIASLCGALEDRAEKRDCFAKWVALDGKNPYPKAQLDSLSQPASPEKHR